MLVSAGWRMCDASCRGIPIKSKLTRRRLRLYHMETHKHGWLANKPEDGRMDAVTIARPKA